MQFSSELPATCLILFIVLNNTCPICDLESIFKYNLSHLIKNRKFVCPKLCHYSYTGLYSKQLYILKILKATYIFMKIIYSSTYDKSINYIFNLQHLYMYNIST